MAERLNPGPRPKEPLRGVERLEWARVTLEEAVARLAKYPEDRAYFVAVISRYHEFDALRFAMVGQVAARPVDQPGDAKICQMCLRPVATLMQHYSPDGWTCQMKPVRASDLSVG